MEKKFDLDNVKDKSESLPNTPTISIQNRIYTLGDINESLNQNKVIIRMRIQILTESSNHLSPNILETSYNINSNPNKRKFQNLSMKFDFLNFPCITWKNLRCKVTIN